MDDSPIMIRKKRQKTVEFTSCVICGEQAPSDELVKPKDAGSWQTLCAAAEVRMFEPILTLNADNPNTIPVVFYHRECRSKFTHKKELARFKRLGHDDDNEKDLEAPRQSGRRGSSETTRVYDRVCVFCESTNKCIKGTSTRETLIQAVDLRADRTLRSVATEKNDTRMLAVTSRDIVAAEACYHASCYKRYTSVREQTTADGSGADKTNDEYKKAENCAYQVLYRYIRTNLFSNPRIVPLSELTSKLVSLLHDEGIGEIRLSTKTHIRRNLESEFGDTLRFFSAGAANKVYLRPNNLSTDSIACDYIDVKDKLDRYNRSQQCEELIVQVALTLRENIYKCIQEQAWPPKPEEMTADYVELPNCLVQFLTTLLGDSQQVVTSDKVQRLSFSIGQDIISAVTNSRVLTPKHLLLPWAIKALTGNVELIKTLNRLGHGCSYTKLQEIDTALCIEKMSNADEDKPTLPSWTHPGIPTVLAFDNIDRQEETLSGGGTSHRVNGVIVQPQALSCAPQRKPCVDKKEKRRTLELSEQQLPIYISGKRMGPPPLKPNNLSTPLSDATEIARQKNFLWILARLHDTVNQRVGSWTGFNIKTRDNVHVKPDKVGYLPTINAPATELTTVQEILSQSASIQEYIGLDKVAVVMDQALYAKATEVAWKQQQRFEKVILMMGNFHVICNMLSIIGKLFRDAGLRDLAVESGVIAEGSIDKVLDGRQYNRGVRLHKLTYEAMMRLVWRSFLEWLETDHSADLPHLDETLRVVMDLHGDVSSTTLDSSMTNESCHRILHLLRCYLDVLRHERGSLATFWMMYVDMAEILLGLIRADREGDWYLHLASIRNMLPWCFALDKTNYARYLPLYYAQMTRLAETCPDLHDHFINGGFSVQLGKENPFGKIAIDQTVEETVNRDTQTAGGTKGFSLKHSALTRFYVTAEHRAEAVRQLRDLVSVSQQSQQGLGHADLQPTRIKKDEADVMSIVDMLENNWIKPFSNQPSDLVSLSTGAAATSAIKQDMLKAHSKGEEALAVHMATLEKGSGFYDPIKKLKLQTFSALQKSNAVKAGANREIILKADNRVFGHMLLIAQTRKLAMKEVLQYPLGPKPWALANPDGTLKKTGKATLGKHLEKEVAYVEAPSGSRATVIDAMAIVQTTHGDNLTFDELSDAVLKKVLHEGWGSERIDVVFDMYREQSIKTAERVNRGSQHGIVFSQIKPGHRIKNWKRILSSTESKAKLTVFIAESWKEQRRREKLGKVVLMVTSGEICFQISKEDVVEIVELGSTQEEADTRMMIHVKHAAADYRKVLVISEDTDVFMILLSLHSQIGTRVLLRKGKKNAVRLIDISRLGTVLGTDVCNALIGVHAFTGCDSVSSFSGQGKVKAVNLVNKNQDYRETFTAFGQQWQVTDDMFQMIQAFTCSMYCLNTKIKEVNTLRYEMFRTRKGDISSGLLPPCEDALRQHTNRANYQAAIWRRSLENSPLVPSPADGHGWSVTDGKLGICWLTGAPAPEIVLELMSCKCPRRCDESCPCVANGFRCTPACKLINCANMEEEDEDHSDSQPMDDSDSEEE